MLRWCHLGGYGIVVQTKKWYVYIGLLVVWTRTCSKTINLLKVFIVPNAQWRRQSVLYKHWFEKPNIDTCFFGLHIILVNSIFLLKTVLFGNQQYSSSFNFSVIVLIMYWSQEQFCGFGRFSKLSLMFTISFRDVACSTTWLYSSLFKAQTRDRPSRQIPPKQWPLPHQTWSAGFRWHRNHGVSFLAI